MGNNKNPINHESSKFVFKECKANVLIMQENKKFEEYEGSIELQYRHGNGWVLLICISEKIVFSHKVE